MPQAEEEPGSGLISVEAALSALGLEVPRDDCLHVEKLRGGLTNDNVVVTLPTTSHKSGKKVVLRRFLTKTSRHLGYDRQQEYDNSRITAVQKGVGAPVVGFVPPTVSHGGALAVEYVEAKTMDEVQIRAMCGSEDGMSRFVGALKRLHSAPALFSNRFDPFVARKQYEEEVQLMTGRAVAWEGYAELVERLRPIQRYLEESPEDLVDCHNDLLGANFLDSGSNLTIIDWELSGQAQPSWELGNLISENGMDGPDCDAMVQALITRYWKDCITDPALLRKKINRARLFSLVSKITWAAWGAVLHNLDKGDAFDYREWSMQRLQMAKLLLDDSDTIQKLCSG